MKEKINFEKVKISGKGYLADSIFIPKDKSNRHYVALQEWINEGGVVESEFSIDEVKATKYEEAETLRKSYQFESITYQDSEFSTSQMARQNMLGVMMILSNSSDDTKHYWKDNEDVAHQFSSSDFSTILSEISTRDTKLYYIEAQIKNRIDKYSNPDSLSELNINDLWAEYEEQYNQ